MNEQIEDAKLSPLVMEWVRLKKAEVELRAELERARQEKQSAEEERDRAIEVANEYRTRLMKVGPNTSQEPNVAVVPITMDMRALHEFQGAELEAILSEVMADGVMMLLRGTPAEETFCRMIRERIRKK